MGSISYETYSVSLCSDLPGVGIRHPRVMPRSRRNRDLILLLNFSYSFIGLIQPLTTPVSAIDSDAKRHIHGTGFETSMSFRGLGYPRSIYSIYLFGHRSIPDNSEASNRSYTSISLASCSLGASPVFLKPVVKLWRYVYWRP